MILLTNTILGKGERLTMKKAIVAVVLFFLLCIPAFAQGDGDNTEGRFGVNVGYYFFNNDALDDSGFFGGVEYKADVWSVALDYTKVDALPLGEQLGGTEQLMLAHIDYTYYFQDKENTSETPTYVGLGYTHRFQGDAVTDKGAINVIAGMDWDQNWNFEAKYIYFDSDDTMWGISAGYFF